MSHTVELPALGESVTEGTVTRWLVAVGDTVAVDDPIVEVSTDKVDTEIPSPVAGVVEQILVEEDEDVEVGAALVVIGDGSSAPTAAPAAPAAEAPAASAPAAPEAPAAAAASAAGSVSGQEVTLPALGESVTEGTVTRWLKEVGEQVEVDEPLVEVSTDKVDTEIPSPVAGTLLEIRIPEDEEAEVGQVLAIIGDSSAAAAPAAPAAPAPAAAAPAPATPAAPAAPASAPDTPATPAAPAADGEAYVTPLVRKLAKDNGIDLSTVKGTGVGGRIRKQDVQAAIAAKGSTAPAAAPAASAAPAADGAPKAAHTFEVSPKRGTVEKTARIRQVIAKRMRESLDISTQLTQVTEVDMTRVAQLRAKAKDGFLAREGAKLTFLPFFAQAVTEALQQHPALNASMTEDLKQITYPDSENVAIAVDTPKGLLVPVIKNASDLGIAGLAKAIGDLGGRARTGDIAPEELTGSTFTITNIGSFGALFDTPIINQPNVAILGTGSIVKRPMVVKDVDGNDSIAIRSMCYLSLTYDHRVVDGADAGRFLYTLKTRLEEANFEAELGL
ncbi:2-oxoglutarate dehydrogenase, E2 component, dihydrolipoamide succinyltransferase [Rothia dentocariosa ATCC 17931]|uniref:Dihydrolipoamide acetyltransferase component of pyruvate dehydrogenase complex n=1 Tax=Rothia dentocariosa (strain ATCC 17931 / CDC X599 / XDIA) TaxID=762948 RepID=E3H441_ROTDC|nr:2-oxoglutarate dehydrogenase, E2 component, dihydrolipoamide succinyltransferase [Rothia dentocariosa]ADP39464.1 2-oxoglutarate dehydrogenase, E2 component, dihydrolipoamide succinyltransferase [Rothia dentocariosa ATCC 17931]WMS32381.1 2-oxoglutarate dehydrogenase, E2 component, dihydrolipoamide succinyltransferase [Rothia dentocariosa]SUE38110.1 Dihydrolipoyllysine-residue succinyltransferase component of 2-oxoglutarate dehydrogenase complex [Rothia dentocariosa]